MIQTSIAHEIWNLKYRNNNESEEDFYSRLVKGLFNNDVHLEHYAQICGLKDGNEFLDLVYYIFSNHLFLPAGRAIYALGTDKKYQTFSNCFVLPVKKDSMDAIMECASQSAVTMKAGGGVGYNFSVLRPSGSLINTSKGQSSGVVSFMKIFNTLCDTIKAGNNRRGAQIAVLSINHPEIEAFISAKRDGSLSNFNLSVFITDEFMSAVDDDKEWSLKFPDSTHPQYNELWDGNYKKWSDLNLPFVVYKTVKARDLFDKIIHSNYNFAEPGILFEDTINKYNNLWYCEYILATNPCGEQPLFQFGSCNLGSINLSKLVENSFENPKFNFEQLCNISQVATIILDKMLDSNYMPLEAQLQELKDKRQIGIGITGLADAFIRMKIKYGSLESCHLSEQMMEIITNTSYQTSSMLAKFKGSFPKLNKAKFLKSRFVQEALSEDTIKLIEQYGIRNSRLISIAPTGTMSLLMNNVSSGIEPVFALEYTRKVKQADGSLKVETVEDFAWKEYKEKYGHKKANFFVTAQDLLIDDHVVIQSIIQQYVDTSISKTINVPVDYPFDLYKDIYINAWKNGLKGCTTYRPNSILGSVLEVKKEDKATAKDVKKQEKEFLEIWKAHENDKVIIEDVPLPDEYPMRGFKVKSEGKKWYFHLAFKDKEKTRPFAIFVQTNNSEPDVNTYNAREILLQLARNQNIPEKFIEETIKKSLGQTNVVKIARILSMLFRHNVQINKIIKCLDSVDVPVSSFVFRVKKFLMKYVEEIEQNGEPCPECGSKLMYRNGCIECPDCNWSKCA